MKDFISIEDELNFCDKCGLEMNTHDLVWITAKDFEPRENEVVKESAYYKYAALCENCYLEELESEEK